MSKVKDKSNKDSTLADIMLTGLLKGFKDSPQFYFSPVTWVYKKLRGRTKGEESEEESGTHLDI